LSFFLNQCSASPSGIDPLNYAARSVTFIGGGTTHRIIELCHTSLYNQQHLISTEVIKNHSIAIIILSFALYDIVIPQMLAKDLAKAIRVPDELVTD
jgi:hypothetical protein